MKILAAIGVAAVLGSISIETGAAAAEDFKKLSGDQIRAKLAGKEHTDEVHWRDVYERDGTLRHYPMGRKLFGKWSVQKTRSVSISPTRKGDVSRSGAAGNRIEMRPTGLGSSFDGILQPPNDQK